MGAENLSHPPGLVGRAPEFGAGVAALARGRGGVLVVGDPGVGKSGLCRALLEQQATRADTEVVWLIPPVSDPPIPFAALTRFVPPSASAAGLQPEPFFLLYSIRTAVLALAADGRRLVLAVDDAHRLDSHSAALVFQLVAAGEALIVAAMRSGVGCPPAMRALWKEGLVERIDLQPLTRPHSDEFVRRQLREAEPAGVSGVTSPDSRGEAAGGEDAVGGDLLEALWSVGGGNPLYLRELVLAGLRSAAISRADDVWRLSGNLRVGPRLAELLEERLGQLNDAETAVMQAVACSEPLPLAVAARMGDRASLEGLRRAGVVTVQRIGDETVVCSAHPLYGEAVRDSLSPDRASELSRALADAFEDEGLTGTELLRVVRWRLDAGQRPRNEDLLAAATMAAAHHAWELARDLADAAAESGDSPEGRLVQADARRALGSFDEALEILGRVRTGGEAAPGGEAPPVGIRAVVLKAVILGSGLGRHHAAQAALIGASEHAGEEERLWLEAVGAGLAGLAGRPADAVRRAARLLNRSAAPGRPRDSSIRPGRLGGRIELTALTALAAGLACLGRPEEALAALEGVETWSWAPAATPDPVVTAWPAFWWAHTARATAYLVAGRIDELEGLARSSYRVALQLHDDRQMGAAAAALGHVAMLRGRLDDAVASLREGVSMLREGAEAGALADALCGLALALAIHGDGDAAGSLLAEARSDALASEALVPIWHVAAAWAAAAGGSVTAALSNLAVAAEHARLRSQWTNEMFALHSMVRLGDPTPAGRLAELEPRLQGSLAAVVCAHAGALASESAAGLDEASRLYGRLGLNLYAAEAAAQASRLHRGAGAGRRATAAAARAHFLLGGSGLRPRPVALDLALTPPSLTRREREVALLAAQGLASSAIAERLCLSVRTVETHLARVYSKLGIGGRGALKDALGGASTGRPGGGSSAAGAG